MRNKISRRFTVVHKNYWGIQKHEQNRKYVTILCIEKYLKNIKHRAFMRRISRKSVCLQNCKYDILFSVLLFVSLFLFHPPRAEIYRRRVCARERNDNDNVARREDRSILGRERAYARGRLSPFNIEIEFSG